MDDIDIKSVLELMGEFSDDENPNSMDKILKITNIFDKVNSFKSNFPYENFDERKRADDRSDNFLGFYNQKIQEKGLKNIHRILPYLDIKFQKNLAIFTKVLELNILQEMLGEYSFATREKKDFKKDLLYVFLENVPSNKKSQLDNMLQLLSFKDIFSEFSNSDEENASTNYREEDDDNYFDYSDNTDTNTNTNTDYDNKEFLDKQENEVDFIDLEEGFL